MRLPQQLAREQHHVRVTTAHDLLGLLGCGNQANRRCSDARTIANLLRKRHLIARAKRNTNTAGQPATGHIDQVDTRRFQPDAKLHRFFHVPSTFGPVGRRNSHHQRRRIRQCRTHRSNNFKTEPRTVFERTAVAIRAIIRQRRQEFVYQVAVRRVQLDHPEPCGKGAYCCVAKCIDHARDAASRHRLRLRIALRERDRTRCHHLRPTAMLGRDGTTAIPRTVRTRLSTGVRELNARYRALRFDEVRDALQHRNVCVIPNAQILRADAPFGDDGGGLGEHQRGTTHRELPQMHEMPIVRQAIFA